MSRIRLGGLLASLLVVVAACGEPTRPSTPLSAKVGTGPADRAALQAQVNGLINALFAPKDQGAIQKQFATIKAQLAGGKTAEAQASIVAFVQLLLTAQTGGNLQDPNGAQPPTTADALRDLVNTVATFGGLPAPLPGPNPFAGDGAVAVVGPAGGTVVSSTGFGGVGFPPGALPDNVIVVVSRLPNPVVEGTGPLPTTQTQYPLFYDFSTVPAVAQFNDSVTVGICQLEVGDPFAPPTQAIANQLQLAHPDPTNPSTIELLPRTSAGFVNCNGVTLVSADGVHPTLASRALDAIGRFFRPAVAYAVHGGLGGKTKSFSPFAAVSPAVITPVQGTLAVGNFSSCLIETSGTTVCWGSDNFGTIGDGGPAFGPPQPRTPVAGSPSFVSVATNGSYICGRTGAGADLCWGRNPAGPAATSPTALTHGPYLAVSPARLSACALTLANTAVCWGLNQLGELGDGTQIQRTSPVPVSTALTFTSIEASWIHTCALTFAGAAHCWGAWQGQNQQTQLDLTPVPVPGGHVFVQLFTGGTHTCALKANQEAWCWGDNSSGQLGDGTISLGGPTPVLVAGGYAWATLGTGTTPNSSGASFTCGITIFGRAYCWGLNDQGQLGDGTTTDRLAPTPVATGEIFVAIGGGDRFTCALTPDGRVFCWGTNVNAELGSGTPGGFSSTPVQVP